MCGISGIIGKNISQNEIVNMISKLSHRGPDAQMVWNDEKCFLGHRRLSIIDLSAAANQPMHSACGRYVIVYNGEIYNFKEIASELKLKLKTNSDTEVILEAFVKLGHDFVNKLNGMFAIAIWDKDLKELHLFRDRIGVKPLYYYIDNEIFAFASELKALTSLQRIKSKLTIDKNALASYFHYGFIPQPLSIYNQIKKFPQAHSAVYKHPEFKICQYWDLTNLDEKSKITSEVEASSQLDELLNSAVSSRLVSDVPFGSFLSGGIDSSIVTALAQKHTSGKLNTFSIGFKESAYDESAFAAKIASFLGTNHHEYILSEKDALNYIPDLMKIYDEPFADSSALPVLLVSLMAKQEVSMVLSGDGGDELFMGYGSYNWAKRFDNPMLYAFRGMIKTLLEKSDSRKRRAARLFDFDSKTNLVSHIFSQEQYLFNNKEVEQLLSFKADLPSAFKEFCESSKRRFSSKELQSIFDLFSYLPDDLLVKVDRASMQNSLEVRVPLLDYRIVEFSYLLDENLKVKQKVQKYLLKNLLYKYIPSEYFDRPKWGFSIPLQKWMRNELKDWIEAMLSSEDLEDLLQNRISEIESVAKWRQGDDMHYNRVWQLAVLSSWISSNK